MGKATVCVVCPDENGIPGPVGPVGPQGPAGPITLQKINGLMSGPVSMLGGGLVFTPNGDDSFTITEDCAALRAFIAACTPPTPSANLAIAKTITPTTFPSGGTAAGTVTLVVSNTGPSPADGMTVTDNIA